MTTLLCWYRRPALDERKADQLAKKIASSGHDVKLANSETCFYVEVSRELSPRERATLEWLLRETFEPENFSSTSFLSDENGEELIEVGPRLSFSTAWCSNAVSICQSCAIDAVTRIERSTRYLFNPLPSGLKKVQLASLLHDRMTECVYAAPLTAFPAADGFAPSKTADVMRHGKAAIAKISDELGLAFDEWDLDFYTKLFKER